MMQVETGEVSEEIQQIAHKIVERFHPKTIILFGSYAYGEPRKDSDADVLVVVPNPPSRKEACSIAHELREELPLQLIFMSPEEFEETKDVVGGIAFPAHHSGKVLYDESP